MSDGFTMSEENKARFRRTCLHYDGTVNSECDEGISYQDVARPLTSDEKQAAKDVSHCNEVADWKIAKRLPCLTKGREGHCPLLTLPTDEDVRKHEEEIGRILSETVTARKAITEHIEAHGHERKNVRDSLGCPVCGQGTLHYAYAGAYNGHVHADCTTDGCVSFME